VESVRQGEQTLAQKVKEEPGSDKPEKKLNRPESSGKPATFQQRLAREFCKTAGADGGILMLGNTFAAKVVFARRTARHSFSESVVETALLSQGWH
jgi:hypothetical protein